MTFKLGDEAILLLARSAEMFLLEISTKCYTNKTTSLGLTIERKDIVDSILQTEVFDFLLDLISK